MTFDELKVTLETAIAEFKTKSENFEQTLADEREAGRRDRDAEVTDLQERLLVAKSDFDAMVVQKDQEKVEFGASEYQRGFVDGGNGSGGGDKIYSQVELDAAVAGAVAPLNEQVMAMQGQIDALNAQLATVDQRISEAVAARLAEFKAALDSVEAQF